MSIYKVGISCDSHVGMKGGEHRIRCSPLSITNGLSLGVVTHELGHALGLHHEHQRMDRDEHVVFVPGMAYIVAGARKVDYVKLIPPWSLPTGAYDCRSVMHYPERSVQGIPYLSGRSGGSCPATIGTRGVPTLGDIAAVKRLYG